ncbi:hypothetical protein CDQ91_07850 [Sphingopyxis witflariensis]|uniref:Uncharacterized protein n=1 Tax=Sphingopyxis witflariensis TaxID=173675 RepID=A0A246JZ60_9SPHN|nr:hypothetical protein CDQ91_07850 [Sphingopyxis witflariensis]
MRRCEIVMYWIRYLYGTAALLTGGVAIFREGVWLGLAGMIAPLLALTAGGGITLAFRYTEQPVRGAIVMGMIFLAVALYWVHSIGWHFQLWGIHLSGMVWCLIGFGIGLLYGSEEGWLPVVDAPE